MNIEKFKISCNAIFDEKKLTLIDGMFHLKEFKVHDYNMMMIKIIYKEIKRVKIDFEQKFTIIIIFELRFKKYLKTIFDSSN